MFRINLSRHLWRRKNKFLPVRQFYFSTKIQEQEKITTQAVTQFQRTVKKMALFEMGLFLTAFAVGSYYFLNLKSSQKEEKKAPSQSVKSLFEVPQKVNQVYEHQLLTVLKQVLAFHLMTNGLKSNGNKKFTHILGGLKDQVEKRKSYLTIKDSLTKMAALNREFIYHPENKEKYLNPELFTRVKEFLVFRDSYVKNKINEEIGWMFGLYEEDVYRLLSILVSHYDLKSPGIMNSEDLEFFEKRMELAVEAREFTGAKAAALRYFYNKEAKCGFGDCLYFGNEEFLKNGAKGNLDILFIHGQGVSSELNQSHAVRGFKIKQQGNRKMDLERSWPVQYLKPALQASGTLKPRIYLAMLESGRTEADLEAFNVPNRSTSQIAQELEKELRKHKIGQQNPFILVGFSLGGIIAKRLLIRMKNQLNVKGALFIGVPHKGSEVVDQTLKQVQDGFSGFTTFETSASHSITKEEFVTEFLDTCKLSQTTKEVSTQEYRKQLDELNENYSQLKIPSWCVSEGMKIKSKISPKSYHLVKPDSALLESCVEKRHLEHKNHYDLQAVEGVDDDTLAITKQFVGKVL